MSATLDSLSDEEYNASNKRLCDELISGYKAAISATVAAASPPADPPRDGDAAMAGRTARYRASIDNLDDDFDLDMMGGARYLPCPF